MISMNCDYNYGAHEKILEKLAQTNNTAYPGYGSDAICQKAKAKIRKACNCEKAEVFFLTGGTQTNQLVIDTMLQNYEGVVAANTGHVSVHEAGAVEFTGHKVLTISGVDGKMNASDLNAYLDGFYKDENHEHMVFPGIVYISHPTEYGTLYTKEELTALSSVCKQYEIPLYLDGARLGYGLMSEDTDVTLQDIAALTDVFYIGGTKVGALFGEALVFTSAKVPKHYITQIKQHGALLAKGWLLGLQFDVLFENDLYFEISRHAIMLAKKLKTGLKQLGYPFYIDSPTNQIFIILENEKMNVLSKEIAFSFWEAIDENHSVIRLATSWATTEEDITKTLEILA